MTCDVTSTVKFKQQLQILLHNDEHVLSLLYRDFEHDHDLDCKYFVKNNVIALSIPVEVMDDC